MAFGIYVHVPYCLQLCSYCDFSKYELGTTLPPEEYVQLVIQEINTRAIDVPHRQVDSVYFGGGTPSLLEPSLILSILQGLAKQGFQLVHEVEITLEINPGTLDNSRIDGYLECGVNRFSVGAQTFTDRLLKLAGRKHSSQDTHTTLKMLQDRKVNYSFDLLFALPTQTLEMVREDVRTTLKYEPNHLSTYCLNVPEAHPLARGRAPEDEQVAMFDAIEEELLKGGLQRYEISNFAKPGRESRHNLLYWTDHPYWGLGVSSHSYLKTSQWGERFWNPFGMKAYAEAIRNGPNSAPANSASSLVPWKFADSLPKTQYEQLQKHESLFDFLHTSLRLTRGISAGAVRLKFGEKVWRLVEVRFQQLLTKGWLETDANDVWRMTASGRVLSNSLYAELTFSAADLGD